VSENSRPRCLFIVDDESLIRLGLENMLTRQGGEAIYTFATAEDALAQLERLRPRLVFMDIQLGAGMTGLEAARQIMERRPCPVIITTAYADDEYLTEAMQAHVFGYLVKPVTPQQLASAMALALNRFEEFERLQSENVNLRDAIETRKVVERAKGLLMEKKKLTEAQAYRILQSKSQEQGKAMREVAQNVLDAADFL
jgi:response regulator NasT